MSSKKIKKYGTIKIPAQSLFPPDKDGYLTKQGGSIKTWKRRYFILKDKTLYYYKTPKDQVFQGKIELEPTSLVKEEFGGNSKIKKQNLFSVATSRRVYFMFPDKPHEMKSWVEAISSGIKRAMGPEPMAPKTEDKPMTMSVATPTNNNNMAPTPMSQAVTPSMNKPKVQSSADMSPRSRLGLAKSVVTFLQDEESKVLEFWQIWNESIPAKGEITGGPVEFHVATSADMSKLTWRTSGPQHLFIQKMVDFFWNVGAPESEIDRLNDVGALINPLKIGSWIDMSLKGGMDGGWYFPVDIPLKMALESADSGGASHSFGVWAEQNGINTVYAVGRDMGAAPPRQTEVRINIPGGSFDEQLKIALSAYEVFGVPMIPQPALEILKRSRPDSLRMSVITSSEGFVRLGIMAPKPSTETVLDLCSFASGDHNDLAHFEGSLGVEGPAFVEYQYLMKTFGYGVYKEGFDIVFHYEVGEETADN